MSKYVKSLQRVWSLPVLLVLIAALGVRTARGTLYTRQGLTGLVTLGTVRGCIGASCYHRYQDSVNKKLTAGNLGTCLKMPAMDNRIDRVQNKYGGILAKRT